MGSSATAKALPAAWKPSTLEAFIAGTFQPWNPPTLMKPADPGTFQPWNSSCKLRIPGTRDNLQLERIAGSERSKVGKLRIPRLQASWVGGVQDWRQPWIVRRMVEGVQGWRVKIASLDGSWVEGFGWRANLLGKFQGWRGPGPERFIHKAI